MANISVNSNDIKSTLNSISTTYESIESVLNEMETKKEELSQFWSSKEATAFQEKLSDLSEHVKSFNDKYASFVAFINDVLETYSTCNSNLISTINSIASKVNSENNETNS